MSAAPTIEQRLDRLFGDTSLQSAERGGGIPTPPVFTTIIHCMLDSGPQTVHDLVEPVRRAIPSNDRRVARLYGSAGYSGLVEDALALLQVGEYVVPHENRSWGVGPKFEPGQLLQVWPERKGKSAAISFRAWDRLDRETLSWLVGQAGAIHSLAYDLRPDGPGLRPLDPKRVEYLRTRIEADGYDERYPVIVDQDTGYILSGRHRLAACRQLGIEPKYRPEPIEDDRERVLFALRENDVLSWSDRDINRLARRLGVQDPANLAVLQTRLSRKATQEAIDQQLKSNPRESDSEIGRRLMVRHETVGKRRSALEETGEIRRFLRAKGGRGKKERGQLAEEPPPEPKPRRVAPGKFAGNPEKEQRIVEAFFEEGKSQKDIGIEMGALNTGNTSSAVAKVLLIEQTRRDEHAKLATVVDQQAPAESSEKQNRVRVDLVHNDPDAADNYDVEVRVNTRLVWAGHIQWPDPEQGWAALLRHIANAGDAPQ